MEHMQAESISAAVCNVVPPASRTPEMGRRWSLERSPYAGTEGPEFRRRAVELARLREKPIAQIAKDLGIAQSGLRRWMAQADIEEGKKDELTSDERAELVKLRRENRVQAMEIEILERASAYFARENILPK